MEVAARSKCRGSIDGRLGGSTGMHIADSQDALDSPTAGVVTAALRPLPVATLAEGMVAAGVGQAVAARLPRM